MQVININLGKEIQEVHIIPISDVHIGDKLCDYKRFKETIERIKNEPNTYTIINGDLMNNAIKSSVSDIYSETIRPSEQIKKSAELLVPIKDKILCITEGNHEMRTFKETGLLMNELVARELNIENKYAPSWWYIYLYFGHNDHRTSTDLYNNWNTSDMVVEGKWAEK